MREFSHLSKANLAHLQPEAVRGFIPKPVNARDAIENKGLSKEIAPLVTA